MKYTKNFPLKLKQWGFELKEEVDVIFHYEDWRKGALTVLVDHGSKRIISYIDQVDEVEINTLRELKVIDKVVNRKTSNQ